VDIEFVAPTFANDGRKAERGSKQGDQQFDWRQKRQHEGNVSADTTRQRDGNDEEE